MLSALKRHSYVSVVSCLVLGLASWAAVPLAAQSPLAEQAPLSEQADAPALSFGSEFAAPGLGGTAEAKHVEFTGSYRLAENSREGLLTIRADVAADMHIYSVTQAKGGPTRSELKVQTEGVELRGEFQADRAPEVKKSEFYDVPVEEHQGVVTWTVPITIPEGVEPEQFSIEVRYHGQVCTNDLGRCIPLMGIPVQAAFDGYAPAAELAAAERTSDAEETAAAPPPPAAGGPPQVGTERVAMSPVQLVTLMLTGFFGGVILNLMPCVLPVIGIKILGLAQQGGMSRARILTLNLWFTLGLLSVFWILAILAVTLNLGWGQQFTYTWFKVGLTALVFAMALSFLGVWEIPLPGFVGAGASNDLQRREGATGAFFKGIFTTILATPCSGPLLGSAFGLVLNRHPAVTLLLFSSIGLGMASPYLAVAASPGLIKWLPRPGMWMETFKQAMAFLLLGTVVYLFSTISERYFLATLTLLIGIWFACWLVGRIPVTAEPNRKMFGWVAAVGTAAVIGVLAFDQLVAPQAQASTNEVAHSELIPWQPFSPAALEAARAEGKTVMVDFTADWCPTCKWNLYWSINTEGVQQVVLKNDIVPMLADWTEPNDDIKQTLAQLGATSIPLLAIYPSDGNSEPIVLRDLIREGQLIDALEQAGPSKSVQTNALVRNASATQR